MDFLHLGYNTIVSDFETNLHVKPALGSGTTAHAQDMRLTVILASDLFQWSEMTLS